ncbi:MAG: hypothetical protein HKP30_03540 [Myxococcales bacterium]|nr:hypothetical protein [Myxococcales bacterium]
MLLRQLVSRTSLGWIALVAALALPSSGAGSDDVELPNVAAQVPWQLEHRDDDPERGYVLYKRMPPGSDFAAYRLEAVIDAPPERVARAARENLLDPEQTQSNVRKQILRNDGDVVIVYSYIDLPLVSDRDALTRAERSFDHRTQSYRLSWRNTDEGPPPPEGVVRVGKSEGSWLFEPAPDGRTKVTYESHSESPGVIPAWVVNSVMNGTVVDGFDKLRARAQGATTVGER